MADLIRDVPLSALSDYSAFDSVVWMDLEAPIRAQEVFEFIDAGRHAHTGEEGSTLYTRDQHIERVAYFVISGWDDPIYIDVGVPEMGVHVDWIITDGNHRFTAAQLRGDRTIKAAVGGSLKYAVERGIILY